MTEPAPRLLYRPGDPVPAPAAEMPQWAVDLRLDELAPVLGDGPVGAARLGVLLTPLPDADAVAYRQEIFRDIETLGLGGPLTRTWERLERGRLDLARAKRMRHPAERDRWILGVLEGHEAAAVSLAEELRARPPVSRGLRSVAAYLDALVASPAFQARSAALHATRTALDGVSFRLRIGEHRVVVSPARDEPDLAAEIRGTFARLRDGEPAPLRVDHFETLDMSSLEAEVLARVAKLFPGPFAQLASTVAAYRDTLDPTLGQIAEDAMWFVTILERLGRPAPGAARTYPTIAPDGRLSVTGLAELLVTHRLLADGVVPATSDLELARAERVVIVTGPSQSGRTSFARAVGQLHVLAAAGCPVPATSATVPLVSEVRTVFDQTERLDDPGGRLRTELRRIRTLLDAAGPGTLIIANEPFASTTAADALALARRLVTALLERGARIVTVTFLEELASEPGAVSVAAATDSADPASRTFRFERRPADGLAHAQLLARRYRLTAADVQARVRR